MNNKPIAFVDVETTSLSAETGEIWEFGGIRREPDGTETNCWFQINTSLKNADSFSLSIGHFYERFGLQGQWGPGPDDLRGGGKGQVFKVLRFPERGEVVDVALGAVLMGEFTRGAHIIGNTVSFDADRMERYMRKNDVCPGWHYHILDIEPMIIGYLKAKSLFVGPDEVSTELFNLPYDTRALSNAIGVPIPDEEHAHTAYWDAEWVKRQWDVIFGVSAA